jgi:hypothetical protein
MVPLGVVELSMDDLIAQMEREAELCAACNHTRGMHFEPPPERSQVCVDSGRMPHGEPCPCRGFVPQPDSPTPVE